MVTHTWFLLNSRDVVTDTTANAVVIILVNMNQRVTITYYC